MEIKMVHSNPQPKPLPDMYTQSQLSLSLLILYYNIAGSIVQRNIDKKKCFSRKNNWIIKVKVIYVFK